MTKPPRVKAYLLSNAAVVGGLRMVIMIGPRPLAASHQGLSSLDPAKRLTQYVYNVWRQEDGLPAKCIRTITQTLYGFLWLATREGLVRFDGVKFENYNSGNTAAFASDNVAALCAGQDCSLWIGMVDGSLLRFKGSTFTDLQMASESHQLR